jgi:hypothetical protein
MPLLNISDFKNVSIVTLGYFCVYYGFMGIGLQGKKQIKYGKRPAGYTGTQEEKIKRFMVRYSDPIMLKADRSLGNMLEQMPVFLTLMWMYAAFVDEKSAAVAGVLYTVVRALYPFFYPPPGVLWITIPNYAVIVYYCYGLVQQILAA